MHRVKYLEDLFESIPVYRKIVLILFFIKNDVDLLHECRFLNMFGIQKYSIWTKWRKFELY